MVNNNNVYVLEKVAPKSSGRGLSYFLNTVLVFFRSFMRTNVYANNWPFLLIYTCSTLHSITYPFLRIWNEILKTLNYFYILLIHDYLLYLYKFLIPRGKEPINYEKNSYCRINLQYIHKHDQYVTCVTIIIKVIKYCFWNLIFRFENWDDFEENIDYKS